MAVWQSDLHPRTPGGDPSGQGGHFATKGGWLLDKKDEDEIARYQENAVIPYFAPVDDTEDAAMDIYTGAGSVKINRPLRLGETIAPEYNKVIKALDSGIAHSKLSEDTMLNRLYSKSAQLRIKDMKPGDALVDKGYLSTSRAPQNWGSSNFGGKSGYGDTELVKIMAPAGTKAAYIMKYGFISEDEVLVHRDNKLSYVGENKSGIKYFKLK